MTSRRGHSNLNATNPSTGEVIAEYPLLEPQEVFQRLRKSAEAFEGWSSTSFSGRAKCFKRLAKLLKSREDKYAALITQEMGKPITQSRAEIQKCAWGCEHFAENSERYLEPEVIDTGSSYSGVVFEPLGAILAVMPWNFPFWQVFRFAAPTLMAGNVGLLKHASDVPGCSLAIHDAFLDAGFPDGVFQSLLVRNSAVKDLIKHPAVKAVSLTGSERAGRVVASEAGAAIKKCVLELGGSDPFIVLDDADLEKTIDGAVTGRMQNTGQSCIAAKRFFVTKKISKSFIDGFAKRVKAMRVGDPMDEDTEIGPIVREDLLDELDAIVKASVERGAEVVCGGKRVDRKGFYFEPTILAKVEPGMEVFDEETFGPIASVTVVRSADEAVALANQTRFGLGASIWTQNVNEAKLLAGRIDAGSVFINGIVKSDPRLPFGGIKASGYGRELSVAGIREFANAKTLWIA
ncbi:MAG: NAD-dependent succinate-semialdehyde dehydrogenase [Fimbriimonadales bacterium]